MRTSERVVPLALTCWTAWSVPPDSRRRQPTHAVTGGRTVALCGAATTSQGGAWPAVPTDWELPLAPCPQCAALVGSGPA